MRTLRGRATTCLVAGTLALLLGACSSAGSHTSSSGSTTTTATTTAPKNGGTLVVGITAETDSWNPAEAEWASQGSLVGSSVLEPLAKPNAKGGADPFLATSWIADSTFDRWLINLRPGVTFQDGEPFNADAVKLNIDTYLNGALSSQVLQPLVSSVAVQGPLSVVVNLKQPWAAFPSSYLDSGSAYMMAPAMIHSPEGGANHPIGTGPFSFVSWTPGSSFNVSRNPHYWQAGLPHLDAVDFRVIPDESTLVAALQDGDVNMILTNSAQDANRLAPHFTVVKDWRTEDDFVETNTAASIDGKPNPFSDLHARLALAYATDRTSIARQIGAGVETASSPWSPGNTWGMPDNKNGWVNYDPAKARQELAQYQADSGQSSLTFTLTGITGSDVARTLQQLQAQWAKVGIHANITTMDQASAIKQLVAAHYQALLLFSYNYGDPDGDWVFWSSTTSHGVGGININFSLYTTPQIDQDLSTGRTNPYPAQRKAAYDDLVHQLNAGAIDDWLYRTPYSLIAQPSVQGLDPARQVPFGNYSPKTWLGDLWLTSW
jgi:peptide/nickel transport system substrate-binding protein